MINKKPPITVPIATNTLTPRDLRDRFADVVNVKDFGAKGDGVTDDTEFLNAAISAGAGKLIYIPNGTYLTSTGLRIPSNTAVVGENQFNTIIKLTSSLARIPCISTAGLNTESPYETTRCENIIIMNLCADGNGWRTISGTSAPHGSAICLSNVKHVLVKDVYAKRGVLHCVDIMSCFYGEPIEDDSVYFTGASEDVVLDHVIAEDVRRDDNITTHYSRNIELRNCVSRNTPTRQTPISNTNCGIEFDDGTSDARAINCYTTRCRIGICLAKGHRNDSNLWSNTPVRDTVAQNCTVEDCACSYYVQYVGYKTPGSVKILDCTSITPVETTTYIPDYTNDSSTSTHVMFFGGVSNFVIDGLSMIGSSSKMASGGIQINPLPEAVTSEHNPSNIHIKNITVRDVWMDKNHVSFRRGLINITGNLADGSYCSIDNVSAWNCNDVPIVYITTKYVNNVSNIIGYHEIDHDQPYSSGVVKVSSGIISGGFTEFSNITNVGYAAKIDYTSGKILSALDSSGVVRGIISKRDIFPYQNTENEVIAERYDCVRQGDDKYIKDDHQIEIKFHIKDPSNDADIAGISARTVRNSENGTENDAGPTGANLEFWTRGIDEENATPKWRIQGSNETVGDTHCFMPMENNTYALGRFGYVIKDIYLGSGSSALSDERLKQDVEDIPDILMRAWGKIRFKLFKFINSVQHKGENARVHAGVIAQSLREAFTSEGIDITKYGFFCYDEWGPEYKYKEVIDSPAKFDESGILISPASTHTEKILVLEGGNSYAVRYEEVLCLECAYQRWLGEQRDAKIKDLERRLSVLEGN